MKAFDLHIIGGFLGAGKSTFLNHLLSQGFGEQQVAVIVNDFGKIQIDAQLIKREAEDLISLPNGCVCCQLQGNLLAGLKRLSEKGHYDRVLLETSGLVRLEELKAIVKNPALESVLRLAHTVVLVDPVRFLKYHRKIQVMAEQVAQADLLVVNRCDLASQATLDGLVEVLNALNPRARSHWTTRGKMDPAKMLTDKAHEESGRNGEKGHRHPWKSFSMEFEPRLGEDRLRKILAAFPEGVYRAKGMVELEGGRWVVVQCVENEVHLDPGEMPSGDSRNRLVLIAHESCEQEQIENALKGLWEGKLEALH